MCKTFYLSIDAGKTYKRLTKSEVHFLEMMWNLCMKELYPLRKMVRYGEPLEIIIREPKDMREIHIYYLHADVGLDTVWRMINAMWQEIEHEC